MKNACEMCLMPFKKDTGSRESDQYCSYCFKNGERTYKGSDVQEFKKYCYENMIKKGMNKYLAKFYSLFIPFAPYWKSKK